MNTELWVMANSAAVAVRPALPNETYTCDFAGDTAACFAQWPCCDWTSNGTCAAVAASALPIGANSFATCAPGIYGTPPWLMLSVLLLLLALTLPAIMLVCHITEWCAHRRIPYFNKSKCSGEKLLWAATALCVLAASSPY